MKKIIFLIICFLPLLSFSQQSRIVSIAGPSTGSSSSITSADILWGTNATQAGAMTNILGNTSINQDFLGAANANWQLSFDGSGFLAGGNITFNTAGLLTGVNANFSGVITGNGSGVTNTWVRTILSGGYSPVALASGNNLGYLYGVHSTVTAVFDQRINLGGISGGYLSNFVIMRTNSPAAGTNIAYKIMHNTSAAGASAITALTNTSLIVTQFGNFSAFATNTSTEVFNVPDSKYNYFTVNVIANTALAAHPYAWTVEWWHQSP